LPLLFTETFIEKGKFINWNEFLSMPHQFSFKVLIFTAFYLLTCFLSRAQEAGRTVPELMERVDSTYLSLSIAERINQLLLIDSRSIQSDYDNSLMNYGGILSIDQRPMQHLNQYDLYGMQDGLPIFFYSLLDEKVKLQLDSMPLLASRAVFDAVPEPALFYEYGLSIAKQCQILGIDAIGSIGSADLFGQKDGNFRWKLSEFNQGLVDGGLLPLNSMNIISYDTLEIQELKNAFQATMILVERDKVPDFHLSVRQSIMADSLLLEQIEPLVKYILRLKLEKEPQNFDRRARLKRFRQLDHYPLRFELNKAAVKVLDNKDHLLPVNDLKDKRIAAIHFEHDDSTVREYLNRYTSIDHFEGQYDMSEEEFAGLWNQLINYDLLICNLYPYESDISGKDNFMVFLQWLSNSGKSTTASFLPKDQLAVLRRLSPIRNLIQAPEKNQILEMIIPQVIFGGLGSESTIGVDSLMSVYEIDALERFGYTYPASAGLDGKVLNRIDSIARFAIEKKAIPGCQILVAKDLQVIYHKSFGYHTYDSLRKVNVGDIYDLASITKVSGALPGLMKLYEEGKFDLDATLGTYLRFFRRGDKKELTFREILAHQAGLMPWIPYWKTTLRKNGKYRWRTLSTKPSKRFPYEVADGLYLHRKYKKKIYRQIRKTELGDKKYLYSGLVFYLFPEIIEEITGGNYEDYIYDNFYKPLGASMRYRPADRFEIDRIVPTEYDSLFRKSQIHGKVHDEGAAMMEGISSNAGLFANANDLAKLFQMYCNYGEYGGKQYLKEATVKEFARCQYPENDNRRALGFDRPLPEPHENGNTAVSVSQSSFGHTGFTGTFAWADPEYNLVYIFLSNRVYPTRENTKLYDLNIRTNIQQVVYDAMTKKENN
jgi:CubicO group peptidase (beta-lactamase class C family)